jgi:hypothetical protein
MGALEVDPQINPTIPLDLNTYEKTLVLRDFQKLNYPNLWTQHDYYSLCSPGNSIFF